MKKVLVFVLVIGVFACTSDHTGDISIVKEYVQAVENLDYITMENLLADDYRGLGPSAGDTIGKVAAVENWKRNVENLYQKIQYTRSQFAGITISGGPNQGNWVANWAKLHIEYKDGRGPVTTWANSNYKIENREIVKSHTFYNETDVLRQLGYVFINPNEL